MFRSVIFSCLFLATFAASDDSAKPTDERIIGGYETDITQVPHQVSLLYEGFHTCGGAIIGPKHILTAAHCVFNKYDDFFSVRAGSNCHFKDGQKIDVVNVTSHPNYDKDTDDYDAAVLVLKEPLTAADGVKIATLANFEPQAGEMVLISGWGSTEVGKGPSDLLQSVYLPVVSKETCKKKFEPDDEITDRMFCAGFLKGGKDSCLGDSGGPVMVRGYLAGIVSWGIGCADENYPGVYTNIASILPWIAAQTQE